MAILKKKYRFRFVLRAILIYYACTYVVYTHKPDNRRRKIYARKDQIYGALLFRRRRILVFIVIYARVYYNNIL